MWNSPRSLKDLCKYYAVVEPDTFLNQWDLLELPQSLVEELISESLLQLELNTLSTLVSQWPFHLLQVRRVVPFSMLTIAPSLQQGYPRPRLVNKRLLTEPLAREGAPEQTNILDAFIKGLLTRRQERCRLKVIDFRGFEEDRRLSIELCRIPALWLTAEKRESTIIFSHLSYIIRLKQLDYLSRYFRKIGAIYVNVEGDFYKDQSSEPVQILLDCHLIADEIALGLSLASLTPFSFCCCRLWLSELQDICLPAANLIHIFDPLKISHFQLDNPRLNVDPDLQLSSIQWIRSLRNLSTLSVPGCVSRDDETTPTAAAAAAIKCLNQSIVYLRYLQNLCLSRCFLKHRLRLLLTGVSQPLVHLNLQDCSLGLEDLEFLIYSWRPFPYLKELNLSRNNFSQMPDRILKALVARTVLWGRLEYFSLAYCSISAQNLCKCLRLIGKTIMSPLITPDRQFPPAPKFVFSHPHKYQQQPQDRPPEFIALKVLCLQSFTPPSPPDLLHQLLYLSVQLPSLRKLQVLPDALYAFPGSNDHERLLARRDLLESASSYLLQLGRPDLTVT